MSDDSKLVATVIKELLNVTSLANEPMAEFLISMVRSSSDLNSFVKLMNENEAPFEPQFVQKIYQVILNDLKRTSIKKEETSENDIALPTSKTEKNPVYKTEPFDIEHQENNNYNNNILTTHSTLKREYREVLPLNEKYTNKKNKIDRENYKEECNEYPIIGKIYKGYIIGIKDFGIFIRFQGLVGCKKDGLCHLSQISTNRVQHPSDLYKLNDSVFAKITKYDALKDRISVSMKGINQEDGTEKQPDSNEILGRGRKLHVENRTPKKKLTSPERWELRQLIASGAISITDHPELEEDLNDYITSNDIDLLIPEEELNVQVSQREPKFIYSEKSKLLTEVNSHHALRDLKLVQKPKGVLNKAAMNGSKLAKEFKEKRLKEIKERKLNASNHNKNREDDPLSIRKNHSLDEHHKESLADIEYTDEAETFNEWRKMNKKSKVSYGKKTTIPIDVQRKSLPVYQQRSVLINLVTNNQFVVIVGETGSGKTTQITQYLNEEGFAIGGKMIGCTQPRRVAAISVAKRVAEETGTVVGREVGYTVRFDDTSCKDTKIKYMTDGMLQREALIDPNLTRYSVIMLDEAHERTIATDVLFALLKKAARNRSDLKLIITSATLDSEKFSKYFNNCPILKIPGRTFPVEILFTKEPEFDYLKASLDVVIQIHSEEPNGDILMFLTGQEEIDTACELLYERIQSMKKSKPMLELIILPVYSSLPSEIQSRIFEPTPEGSRKCVIATNIAETSITIDGIFYVVDPGFVKINAYDAKLGMDSLIVSPISQAQANQRAGRAGRTGPGKCYRLYTEQAYKKEMLPNTVPEIQRQNLSNTILMLKAMGINDLIHFEFMDPPPMKTMLFALEELFNLTALDDDGNLTALGKTMSEFPMDPSLAKALIVSVNYECSDEMLSIVSMLSVQTVFYRPKNKQQEADHKKQRFHNPHGDHLTLLNVYNAWINHRCSKQWCEENYVQDRSMRRAKDIKVQLCNIFKKYGHPVVSCGRDYDRIRLALCSGFFKNSAKRDSQENGVFKTLDKDTPVYLHPSSALFGKRIEYVIYHTLVLTTREYMHFVTSIEPQWLVDVAPTFFQVSDPANMNNHKRGSLKKKIVYKNPRMRK